MEKQLDYVVAKYAHNQLRNCSDSQESIIEVTDATFVNMDIEMEERSEHTREIHVELTDEVVEENSSAEL